MHHRVDWSQYVVAREPGHKSKWMLLETSQTSKILGNSWVAAVGILVQLCDTANQMSQNVELVEPFVVGLFNELIEMLL